LKYRTELSTAWRWVNDSSKLTNGELLLQPEILPPRLSDLFSGLSSAFDVRDERSEVPETNLWTIKHPVKPAVGEQSTYHTESLGTPKDYTRAFALERLWTPWLGPRHSKSFLKLPQDAVTCSFLRYDGLHLVLLAISGVGDITAVFRANEKGELVVTSRNDSVDSATGVVVAAIGFTQATALAACMYQARNLVFGRDSEASNVSNVTNRGGVEANWLQEWYDGITFCTWNALGQDLTEKKIFDALDDLKKNNIHVGNLIIDDNWQDLDNEGENQMARGWIGFEANKKGFSQGIKHTAEVVRKNHPSIKTIAVWHALLGYWGGIAPEGDIAKKYQTKVVRKAPIKTPGGWTYPPGKMTVVDHPDIGRMYQDF